MRHFLASWALIMAVVWQLGEPVVVEVEGISPLGGRDEQRRRAALRDAYIEALRTAGLLKERQQTSERATIELTDFLRMALNSQQNKHIREVRPGTPRHTPEGRIVMPARVRIQPGPLLADPAAIKTLAGLLPRFSVAVLTGARDSEASKLLGSLNAALLPRLQQCNLVDQALQRQLAELDSKLLKEALQDPKAAAAIASQIGTDLLLRVSIRTASRGKVRLYEGLEWRSAMVVATAEGIEAATGRVRFAIEQKAIGQGPATEAAMEKALAKCLDALVPEVAREVLKIAAASSQTHVVKLIVRKTTWGRLAAIGQALRKIDGVSDVAVQSYAAGTAVFLVHGRLNGPQFAEAIQDRFEIEAAESARVVATEK